MYDLDKAIQQWRSRISRKGVDAEDVDELASHLRDAFDDLVRAGHSEEEAFLKSVHRIGEPDEIANEFQKVEKTLLEDRIVISTLGVFAIVSAIQLIGSLLMRADEINISSTVLLINVGALTICLIGLVYLFSLGGYCVLRRFVTGLGTVALGRFMCRILTFLAPAGVGLAVVGLVTGCIWSAGHRDSAWSWHMKEVGGVLLLLWYLGAFFVARKNRFGLKGMTMLMLTGGLLTHFSWFVIGGMPLTTVSLIVAVFLAGVYLAAFLAFRSRGEGKVGASA